MIKIKYAKKFTPDFLEDPTRSQEKIRKRNPVNFSKPLPLKPHKGPSHPTIILKQLQAEKGHSNTGHKMPVQVSNSSMLAPKVKSCVQSLVIGDIGCCWFN